MLYPEIGSNEGGTSLNNSSLVLKLVYGQTELLFTGDIDSKVEAGLVEEKADIGADILKIAHHGSGYSTTEAFLELVKPQAAVISVGKNNFGHPSQKVLDRLDACKIKVFRTDEDGAVILTSNGMRYKIRKTA